jgi:hypothetical protein
VSFHRRPPFFLTFLVGAAIASRAGAGEFGPTSRATISISITIPPDVRIRPARQDTDDPNPTDGLCLATERLPRYRIAFVDPKSPRERNYAVSPTHLDKNSASPTCKLGQTAIDLTHAAGALIQPRQDGGSLAEPLTLLIIPD